jgi:hypothetical protein
MRISADRLPAREGGRQCLFQISANKVLVDSPGYGDAGFAEDVGDLGIAEARGVVFESEMVLLFVDAKAAQAIGVGESAEAAELFETQGRLQFVSDFEERHARNYSSTRDALRTGAAGCGAQATVGRLDNV